MTDEFLLQLIISVAVGIVVSSALSNQYKGISNIESAVSSGIVDAEEVFSALWHDIIP